jgi:hypothetical protein
MLRTRVVVIAFVAATLSASATIHAQGPCAATPEDAFRLAREAVATGDAGLVMQRLSPDFRTKNAVELAIGASMVAQISGLSGELSSSPEKAAAAKKAEAQLLAELDTILKKYKAPTIKEIGTPLMMKLEDPAVLKQFAPIDHVAYAREMEAFFGKVEKAAAAAGVKGEPSSLGELVVGGGDLKAPLTNLKVTGDTATANAGRAVMKFRKTGSCWIVDGHD